MSLADKCEDRILSMTFNVRLEPAVPCKLGETDGAAEVGRELIEDTMRALQAKAEAEGFKVTVTASQVTY